VCNAGVFDLRNYSTDFEIYWSNVPTKSHVAQNEIQKSMHRIKITGSLHKILNLLRSKILYETCFGTAYI
jgi:hypothetical protein